MNIIEACIKAQHGDKLYTKEDLYEECFGTFKTLNDLHKKGDLVIDYPNHSTIQSSISEFIKELPSRLLTSDGWYLKRTNSSETRSIHLADVSCKINSWDFEGAYLQLSSRISVEHIHTFDCTRKAKYTLLIEYPEEQVIIK